MIGRMLLRRLGVADALGKRQPSDVVYRVAADGLVEPLSSSEQVPTEFRFRSL
jgi:probable phosphoglycerate mutase